MNIMQEQTSIPNKGQRYGTIIAVAVLFLLAFALTNLPISKNWTHDYITNEKNWKPHNSFIKKGKALFQIFPDPELVAGTPYGYMIHFTEPFTQFSGKKLSIVATHKETGTKVTAMEPQTISSPSPGYKGLERFTASFGLPLHGIWKYEVLLDGANYGDAVLEVKEPSWEVSPTFSQGPLEMMGEKNKIGLVNMNFVGGKRNRFLWYFWGEEQEFAGSFKILGVKEGTNDIVNMYSRQTLRGNVNGADRSAYYMESNISSGRWRLMAYFHDHLFGSVVIDVK
jgi:hypothetical protein